MPESPAAAEAVGLLVVALRLVSVGAIGAPVVTTELVLRARSAANTNSCEKSDSRGPVRMRDGLFVATARTNES